MAEGKKARPREEELVEAALAAAAAALLVSGVKRLVVAPAALGAPWWWPASLSVPSPALFLLLNVVIASIVVASVQPRRGAAASAPASSAAVRDREAPGDGTKRVKRKRSKKRTAGEADVADGGGCVALAVADGPTETAAVVEEEVTANEEAAGNAEEVDRRAEEFISAFRHHLRVDSSSGAGRNPKQR
ncbi:hypothetical protein BS78_02G258100 [Paspalum vaginatum]|nr:hypothetical protein BS78_02G258100 [Paspalum vaginatum]